MKQEILKLKLELKNLAKTIRIQKNKRKSAENGLVPGLLEQRSYYRHRHVLYCLARGKKLEQIDSGKGLNMEYINFQLEAMQSEENKKLYVIVDKNLPINHQAVQAAHVVAQFMKEHPATMWKNGTLVLLKYDIKNHCPWGRWMPYEYAEFREPDLGNKLTGFAFFGPGAEDRFKGLPLV